LSVAKEASKAVFDSGADVTVVVEFSPLQELRDSFFDRPAGFIAEHPNHRPVLSLAAEALAIGLDEPAEVEVEPLRAGKNGRANSAHDWRQKVRARMEPFDQRFERGVHQIVTIDENVPTIVGAHAGDRNDRIFALDRHSGEARSLAPDQSVLLVAPLRDFATATGKDENRFALVHCLPAVLASSFDDTERLHDIAPSGNLEVEVIAQAVNADPLLLPESRHEKRNIEHGHERVIGDEQNGTILGHAVEAREDG
jgi:hypothetical protein